MQTITRISHERIYQKHADELNMSVVGGMQFNVGFVAPILNKIR